MPRFGRRAASRSWPPCGGIGILWGIHHATAVQVDHPGARALSPSELALLDSFRTRLHQRVSSVGLTVDDVRQLVKAMHAHPEASAEVIRIMREEASTLLPGQRLLSFDWD